MFLHTPPPLPALNSVKYVVVGTRRQFCGKHSSLDDIARSPPPPPTRLDDITRFRVGDNKGPNKHLVVTFPCCVTWYHFFKI